eukprot:gene27098-biopygen17655
MLSGMGKDNAVPCHKAPRSYRDCSAIALLVASWPKLNR